MRLALLALVAACGNDPGGVCARDNEADPGAGCAVPLATITVDGDTADWDGIPVRACTTCADGDVTQVRSTRTADGRIAFLLDTQGAPLVDTNHSYLLSLGPLREPSYWIDIILQPATPPDVTLNTLPITGLPLDFAFGATAIEIAFPIAALPHGGGVNAYAGAAVFDAANSNWVPQAQLQSENACWDPTSPVCQPL